MLNGLLGDHCGVLPEIEAVAGRSLGGILQPVLGADAPGDPRLGLARKHYKGAAGDPQGRTCQAEDSVSGDPQDGLDQGAIEGAAAG